MSPVVLSQCSRPTFKQTRKYLPQKSRVRKYVSSVVPDLLGPASSRPFSASSQLRSLLLTSTRMDSLNSCVTYALPKVSTCQTSSVATPSTLQTPSSSASSVKRKGSISLPTFLLTSTYVLRRTNTPFRHSSRTTTSRPRS